MNLDRIENSWIDDRYKGIPGGGSPFRLRDIGQQGWNILQEVLSLPIWLSNRQSYTTIARG
ncbi:hypothetical protein [Bremerella alba]|uniref:Uncharacterized protein n=1 Tax=Bremerella alba TaxID=980252 RepID=A0A7V9A624_9BACT|nr:hypothetical protein [Bremerella alba]MBA2113828.1 hypothetical protein [Bremerella alba]